MSSDNPSFASGPDLSAPGSDPEVFDRILVQMTPRVWVTYLLIGVNAVVFAIMVASGVHILTPTTRDIFDWGGNFAPATTSGQWWRLMSCAFLHIGVVHLVFNMYVLAVTGPLVERLLGNLPFALMYLVSALAGSIASTVWNAQVVSAGASAAVFGVYGALLGFIVLRRGTIPVPTLMSLRNSALAFIGYNVVFGLTVPHIDMAAHLGGLAGGFACGLILSQPLDPAWLPARLRRSVLVLALGLALAGAAMLLLQPSGT